jgi:hypothetical protein
VSNVNVEILETDQRRVALLAIAVVAAVTCLLIGIALLIRPKTPFEQEQALADARNPKGVEVEITTSDGRREYRYGEPIFVVPHFSSTLPYAYRIDVADGFSSAAATDKLHISTGQRRMLRTRGITCCSTQLVGLDEVPFFTPRYSTDPLTLAPGNYEIYLTSRRVFEWNVSESRQKQEDYPSSFEVASNMLKIRVVADSVRPGR